MSKQWAADFHHGRRGQSMVHAVDHRCVECKKDATPRILYCSDECALKSVQRVWTENHKEDPLPPRLASLSAYVASRP